MHNSMLLTRQFSTAKPLAGSKSSKAWLRRQMGDRESREAKVMLYKSRAAFKLIQIDQEHKLLHPGMTVVDLGYAPGSWSQVAVAQTSPGGRVVGIDLLPAPPPKGASAIQGNFLSPGVQASLRRYLSDPDRGRPKVPPAFTPIEEQIKAALELEPDIEGVVSSERINPNPVLDLDDTKSSGYIAQERRDSLHDEEEEQKIESASISREKTQAEKEQNTVDVVLSDMCAPWPLISGFHMNTVLIPWQRLMNTSGVPTRDHAESMRLCTSALLFCVDVLKPGGSFVCKYYQGADDEVLKKNIKKVFATVKVVKPESSRSESKESYFVAKGKFKGVKKESISTEALEAKPEGPHGWNI
ncbi:hypothetical protein H072_8341 [Dactylellina haptotyla CBS 200.50]|uniref:rRNA methyltransferase 2, mitochondrial n=1 Tax=Dactylellina haptotyla (strain CBS 200.50) TaxID=1284197 RepID=S8A4I0_DACHA|nr:hypothetical protein H072_8341 [Dactylellina haptotyla CBS 200.50]